MLINFIGITIFYKLFKKNGLFIWIAISSIIANIQVLKTIELFGYVCTLGNIIYSTSFLATDILSENYGKEEAKKGIMVGIATLITTTIIMSLALKFNPHSSDFSQESLNTIFGIMPRIALGSVTAYVISQLHDAYAYEFWKNKTKSVFIANNLSTMVSQAIDTVIFTSIAFIGVLPIEVIVEIGITTYLFKWIVAACDTPFLYLARKTKKNVDTNQTI